MKTARGFIRAVVLFVAAAFVLSQLFDGAFSLGGTLAGIGGVLTGALAALASRPAVKRIVLTGCVLGLLGAALHAYEYYASPHLPGSYYAWFLTAPFALGLVLIVIDTLHQPEPAADPRAM